MDRMMWLAALGALVAVDLSCSGDKDTDTGVTDNDPGDDDDDNDTGTGGTGDTGTITITVPTPTGDPATVELSGECPLETKYGAFTVQALEGDLSYSTVAGAVADGVVPITVLELLGDEGGCQLLRRNNAFCDPLCQAGETCTFEGECIPFPENQDIGLVTIGGLVDDVILKPIVPGNTYFIGNGNAPYNTTIAHPAFAPGELVELRTNGTTFGEDVVLHGVGVEIISLGAATSWVVQDGVDFPFTWEPPVTPGRSEIHVKLNIDQHGTTPVTLFCRFDDTGSASIPGSLIGQLVDFGVTGFPNATVTRRTVDSTTISDGCMQFEISSPFSPDVLVDGYIPCSDDPDCPEGQVCDDVTFICEPE